MKTYFIWTVYNGSICSRRSWSMRRSAAKILCNVRRCMGAERMVCSPYLSNPAPIFHTHYFLVALIRSTESECKTKIINSKRVESMKWIKLFFSAFKLCDGHAVVLDFFFLLRDSASVLLCPFQIFRFGNLVCPEWFCFVYLYLDSTCMKAQPARAQRSTIFDFHSALMLITKRNALCRFLGNLTVNNGSVGSSVHCCAHTWNRVRYINRSAFHCDQ